VSKLEVQLDHVSVARLALDAGNELVEIADDLDVIQLRDHDKITVYAPPNQFPSEKDQGPAAPVKVLYVACAMRFFAAGGRQDWQ
jgi:hypothetical protein